jgi:hypothetical protein
MSAAPQNPGQIVIKRGQFSTDTCTTQDSLIANQASKPVVRKLLEYKNKRYLMTLLTSGALQGKGSEYFINNDQVTKVPLIKVPEVGGIGSNAYQFDVIGRIEKAAQIKSQIGASGANGSFTLLMLDTYLYPGQMCRFSSGYQARVQGYPTGSVSAGYVYNFQSPNGTVFNYATHVGSIKTCFPMFTAYSEGSLNSDSRDKHPDRFIQHMTIQRKTCSITGSAKSDVLWYEYENGEKLGWMPWKISQSMAQMAEENERHKWFAVSSMKNADGSLATTSNAGVDPGTGLPIIIGDGFEEQVSSGNIVIGSGTNGEFTETNFSDIMRAMQLQSNQINGITWVAVTGTDGFANAQVKMVNLAGNQNITIMQSANQTDQVGGAQLNMGYTFAKFNVAGNSVVFVINPIFDDPQMFPEVGLDGRSLMSSSYFFMAIGGKDTPTIEIMAKEANGVNRSWVSATLIGMTGSAGTVQSEVDADKYAMLKEDLLAIYNTQCCGIGYKAS